MRNIVLTKQYIKDLEKLRLDKKFNEDELDAVIEMLANDVKLASKYKDHGLKGKLKGFRDCHIHPDWILIYGKTDTKELRILELIRLNSHSNLF